MHNILKKHKVTTINSRFAALAVLAAILCQSILSDAKAEEWEVTAAVVAKINGQAVGKRDIEEIAGYMASDKVGGDVNAVLTEDEKYAIARQSFQLLVRSVLLRQQCAQAGIGVKDAEILERIQSSGVENNKLNRMITRDNLLFEQLMRLKGKPVFQPTPSKVRKFFRENKEYFSTPRMIRARQIKVPKQMPETRSIEISKAKRIWAEATAPEANFAQIAMNRCNTPAEKHNGGMMLPPGSNKTQGFFVPENPAYERIYAKEVLDALKTLKQGQVSDIIESPFAFHIIYIERENPAMSIAFKDAQRNISRHIMETERVKRQRNWLRETVEKSEITWNDGSTVPLEDLLPPAPTFNLGRNR